ncbi:hypothetical protein PPYR_02528 [Photinus pyralis]|uniref:Endonuclease/exonuclease/phosphatase domain-containing protein n=1 Tax=Photinus pyralis TaxID=7054 RepID=A0A5N4B7N3_PHOPY|nr:hypothetical protein PPYR_02528 [Photinus pyralis]
MENGKNNNQNFKKPITFLQINSQHSKTVAGELFKISNDKKLDILLIQEPYNFKHKIIAFPNSKIITGGKIDEEKMSAIIVLNNDLEIIKLEQFCTTHTVVIKMTNGLGWITIINSYVQFSEEIEKYIEEIENILKILGNGRVIISMDSNSKSTMWFNNITDGKGKKMEQFIAENNLVISNKPIIIHINININGLTNIDLTLITNNLIDNIFNWKVHENLTVSDHNVITFNINFGKQDKIIIENNKNRYSTKKNNKRN